MQIHAAAKRDSKVVLGIATVDMLRFAARLIESES
jgi:hypothetical protein